MIAEVDRTTKGKLVSRDVGLGDCDHRSCRGRSYRRGREQLASRETRGLDIPFGCNSLECNQGRPFGGVRLSERTRQGTLIHPRRNDAAGIGDGTKVRFQPSEKSRGWRGVEKQEIGIGLSLVPFVGRDLSPDGGRITERPGRCRRVNFVFVREIALKLSPFRSSEHAIENQHFGDVPRPTRKGAGGRQAAHRNTRGKRRSGDGRGAVGRSLRIEGCGAILRVIGHRPDGKSRSDRDVASIACLRSTAEVLLPGMVAVSAGGRSSQVSTQHQLGAIVSRIRGSRHRDDGGIIGGWKQRGTVRQVLTAIEVDRACIADRIGRHRRLPFCRRLNKGNLIRRLIDPARHGVSIRDHSSSWLEPHGQTVRHRQATVLPQEQKSIGLGFIPAIRRDQGLDIVGVCLRPSRAGAIDAIFIGQKGFHLLTLGGAENAVVDDDFRHVAHKAVIRPIIESTAQGQSILDGRTFHSSGAIGHALTEKRSVLRNRIVGNRVESQQGGAIHVTTISAT